MNIFFVGQTSILGNSARERRIQALARELSARGSNVTAFSATERNIRRANAMRLGHTPSFDPSTPGGWLYTLLSFLRALNKQTDVIHLHGWKATVFMPLAAFIRPQATFIWSIDTIPTNYRLLRRLTVWLAARLCDAITVPTRDLQYRFRLGYRVLAAYVPDGYTVPAAPSIPASYWKLRKHTYTLAVVDSANALRQFCLAYKDTKKRKKVAVLVRAITPALKRIEKKHSFLRLITSESDRQRSSLIRQAGQVIFLDAASNQEFLLAMDTGAPLLAVNLSRLQELAGTTVQFFRLQDRKHLGELLREKPVSARKAQIRARVHFAWSRIFAEYETLYHYPKVLRVPVDSIQQSRLVHGEVY